MTELWEDFMNAIILQAVKDYRTALWTLKRKPGNENARLMVQECEEFFRSGWYELLTDVDGEMLLGRLREESA